MGKYFGLKYIGQPFEMFSDVHLITILLIFVINVLSAFLFYKYVGCRPIKWFRYCFAVFLLSLQGIFTVWEVCVKDWSAAYSLPLHLCDVAVILAGIMLLSKSKILFEITYFWGMGGSIQALLTPDLAYPFPHFMFFFFFVYHGAIITAILFKIFSENYTVLFKSIFRVFAFTNAYALAIAGVNLFTHGNYLFICRKPLNASLIDYLGPWPWYIISLEAVAMLTFLICYLPFAIGNMMSKLQNSSNQSGGVGF